MLCAYTEAQDKGGHVVLQTLWSKYKGVILYLFFGFCTTVINIVAYFVAARVLCMRTVSATCAAWVVAVIFAFISNKVWVFESRSWAVKAVLYEAASFFAARIATGGMDVAIMYIFVDKCGMNDVVIKTASNVIVIIANYVASKLIVFKKK